MHHHVCVRENYHFPKFNDFSVKLNFPITSRIDLQLGLLCLRTSAYFCVRRRKTNNLSRLRASNFPLLPPRLSNVLQNEEGEQLIDYFAQPTTLKNYFSGLKSWAKLKSSFFWNGKIKSDIFKTLKIQKRFIW